MVLVSVVGFNVWVGGWMGGWVNVWMEERLVGADHH